MSAKTESKDSPPSEKAPRAVPHNARAEPMTYETLRDGPSVVTGSRAGPGTSKSAEPGAATKSTEET